MMRILEEDPNIKPITITVCSKVYELLEYLRDKNLTTPSESIEEALTQYYAEEWVEMNAKNQ